MKVLLIDIDSKMPNLALMKISAYHKSKGDKVSWSWAAPNKVYISCVFSENLPHAKGISLFYPDAEIKIGGPALEQPNSLPNEIEYCMPDYSLYPDMDYSLGFTTRGCIRNCPFCMVPKIEGYLRKHKHPSMFHNPDFDKIVLFDNNLLASESWLETCQWIQDQGLKVCFNQGLDARLVNEEKAKLLSEMDAYNLHFTSRTFYFSWDLMGAEQEVLRGLREIINAGVNPRSLMIYMLVGFNTTHEQDYYRFQKLVDMNCDPFIMIYNNRKDDPWIRHFARWVNKRIYKVCDVSDYERFPLDIEIQSSLSKANE